MASPRVFVSSTCYDLKYIRENLRFFIKTLGFEPVLSEEGSVFYDPRLHVQDACLSEVQSCHLFVLIIGGRYGVHFKDTDRSITNREFLEAVKYKIPIFALVEQKVYEQYFVYLSNMNNEKIDAKHVVYPSVDSIKIFHFISEVQNQSQNNALVPFSDFESIQFYLKQQWAAMFHNFLTKTAEQNRVADILDEIGKANEKIEFLSRQLLKSIGDPITQLRVKVYDYLINQKLAHDLAIWGIKITPDIFLKNDSLDQLCDFQIVEEDDEEEHGSFTITYGGPPYKAGPEKIKQMRKWFKNIKKHLLSMLEDEGVSMDDFIKTSH